jgi:hypothetical protein
MRATTTSIFACCILLSLASVIYQGNALSRSLLHASAAAAVLSTAVDQPQSSAVNQPLPTAVDQPQRPLPAVREREQEQEQPIWSAWGTPAQRLLDCGADGRLLDIVLVYCRKDPAQLAADLDRILRVPSVASRKPCLHIYAKGCTAEGPALLHKHFPWATRVVSQPNQGREGAAHLDYISSSYHSPPKHAMFLQDDFASALNSMLPKLRHLFRWARGWATARPKGAVATWSPGQGQGQGPLFHSVPSEHLARWCVTSGCAISYQASQLAEPCTVLLSASPPPHTPAGDPAGRPPAFCC